jgi:hypothetical protein
LSVSHSLASFFITIDSELITTTNTTQIYIDSDNNPATGFNINGMGADYRVINNELSRYRPDNRTWVEPITEGIVKEIYGGHRAVTSIARWRILSRRNISVMATIVDEENNIIHTYDPIAYEVRADNDEITISLDDPNFYEFTIHSADIGENPRFDEDGRVLIGGRVSMIYLGLDLDNNINTGRTHFDIGDEFMMGTWNNGTIWEWNQEESRWYIANDHAEIILGNNSVTFRIARDRFNVTSTDGTINTGSVFNDRERNGWNHYFWPNRYEFNLN